jgi:hypothetical protein
MGTKFAKGRRTEQPQQPQTYHTQIFPTATYEGHRGEFYLSASYPGLAQKIHTRSVLECVEEVREFSSRERAIDTIQFFILLPESPKLPNAFRDIPSEHLVPFEEWKLENNCGMSVAEFKSNDCGTLIIVAPRFLEMMDIGTFGHHGETVGISYLDRSYPLTATKFLVSPESPESQEPLFKNYPAADPAATFDCVSTAHSVLDLDACNALISHLDSQYAKSTDSDLKLVLSKDSLISLITPQAYVKILESVPNFPSDYTSIKLRRTVASNYSINLHTDVSLHTVQIPLNSNYKGGQLVYLTSHGVAGGSGCTVHAPKRPAGSCSVHTNKILHGVTKFTEGTRYGLFFLKEGGDYVETK